MRILIRVLGRFDTRSRIDKVGMQCCGSGIPVIFLPLDPGWEKIQSRDPGKTSRILFLNTCYRISFLV